MIYKVVRDRDEVSPEDRKQTLVKLSKIVNFKNKDIALFSLYKDGEGSGGTTQEKSTVESRDDKRLAGMNMF